LERNLGNHSLTRTTFDSRVIAVHVDGSVRWSVEVSGYVEGTPVIGIDGTTVYVSHNVPVSKGYQGTLSVIKDYGGNVSLAAELTNDSRTVPFGPLTIRYDSSTGAYKDVVFWGESSRDGGTENPSLYVLLPSEVHSQNNGIGSESYFLKTFSTLERALVMKPTVSADLSGLWVGGGSSLVAGWTGDQGPASNLLRSGLVSAGWETSLEMPEWDPTQRKFHWNTSFVSIAYCLIKDLSCYPALPTAFVVSSDSSAIYLTDTSFNLVSIDAATGSTLWSSDGNRRSGYMVEPRLSEIEGESGMIYTIETQQGNVRQHDADSGDLNWAFDCSDLTGESSCMDSVEGEFRCVIDSEHTSMHYLYSSPPTFSLSSNGNQLFFADIFGKVTALQVANFPDPAPFTSVPTDSAAPQSPSAAPQSTFAPTNVAIASSSSAPSAQGTEVPPSSANVAPTGSTPTEGNSSPSGSQANSAANTPTSSASKDQTLIFSLIGVAGASCIVAFGFIALLLRRRRKAKQEDEEVHKETEAQRKRREQQRLFEEECRRQELAILQEIGAVPKSAPTTPKRSNRKVIESEDRTPSTLASIDEVDNEDVSLAPSAVEEDGDGSTLNSDYSAGPSLSLNSLPDYKTSEAVSAKHQGRDMNSSNENSFAYLPVALAASFDKVIGPLGLGGGIAGDKRSIVSEEQLASDRPWIHADQRADDDSSIGSESLFIEDDASIKSGSVSATIMTYKSKEDEISQPGQIVSKSESESQNEKQKDPWTAIMSSIIAAEHQFFNPMQASKPIHPRATAEPRTLPPVNADPQTPPRATVEPHNQPPALDDFHTPPRTTFELQPLPQNEPVSETRTPTNAARPTKALQESDVTPPQAESLTSELPFDEAPTPPPSPLPRETTRSILL
jgi:hypothetical protein